MQNIHSRWYYILPLFIGCDPIYSDIMSDSNLVTEWRNKAQVSFEKAESEVFVIKPKPDDVVGPHPDASKCICGGVGIIVQGDGHESPCPFHYKSSQKIRGKQ